MKPALADKIAKALRTTTDEVQKWDADATDVAVVDTHLGNLRIHTSEEFSSTLNSYRDSLTEEMIPAKVKDKIHKNGYAAARETVENDLLKKYGLELKRGEGFSGTDDLVDKIIAIKARGSGDPTADQKKIGELEQRILALNKTSAEELEKVNKAGTSKYFSALLNAEFRIVRDQIDIEDEKKEAHMEFLRYQFDKQYTIHEDENGNITVLDKAGQTLKDEKTFKPRTLESVVMSIVNSFSKIKDVSQKGGRGAEQKPAGAKPGEADKIDWSAYATWPDFLKSSFGKGLVPGSKLTNEYYAAFKKAKGQ